MLSEIGFGVMSIALVVCLYGCLASIYGRIKHLKTWIESGRIAALCIFPLLSLAIACLLTLILQNHFDVQYVAEVSSRDLPLYLKISALWGGQAGSLLFWCWLISGAAFVHLIKKKKDDNSVAWAIIILLLITGFFIGLTLFTSDPFERYFIGSNGEWILSVFKPSGAVGILPPEGSGMNPLLRHPAMTFHPPTLYLGFTIFLVPFASLLATLLEGRVQQNWLDRSRPWILTGWIFLSIGLVLGSRWAYDVLGWGGYWGWDPVEIAALMPWLSATALLHTQVQRNKEKRLSPWSASLVIMTFGLVILGTFITRSGLVTSIHAFTESKVGVPLLVFIIGMLITAGIILGLRWRLLGKKKRRTPGSLKNMVLWLTNAVFLGILLVCLWGIFYPTISENLFHRSASITPTYYKSANGPLFLMLLFLMGVCPLIGLSITTVKDLGKKTWLPVIAASISSVILLLCGIRYWLVLLISWILVFTGAAIFWDLVAQMISLGRRNASLQGDTGKKKIATEIRRFGAFFIHVSIILIGLGIIGMEFFQNETERTLKTGIPLTVPGYTLNLIAIHTQETSDWIESTMAEIEVTREDGVERILMPIQEYYSDRGQTVSRPTRWGDLKDELYIVLATVNSDISATFKIYVNPLVNWLWLGGMGLILGGSLALTPIPTENKVLNNPKGTSKS